jgi:hypothetical protein
VYTTSRTTGMEKPLSAPCRSISAVMDILARPGVARLGWHLGLCIRPLRNNSRARSKLRHETNSLFVSREQPFGSMTYDGPPDKRKPRRARRRQEDGVAALQPDVDLAASHPN